MSPTIREMRVIIITIMSMLVLVLVLGKSDADIVKDRQECANHLVALATCLPYVGGQAKAPTQDCCTGFNQVLRDSKKCLCLLLKDRDDPSVGVKFNASLAFGLPHACHAPDQVTASRCIDLLQLEPNSTDAKAFVDIAKAAAPSSPTPGNNSSYSTTSGNVASDGGIKHKSWVEASSTILIMFYGSLMILLITL